MAAIFTWLDQSEEQRRRMLDVLHLFREQGTVDELGLGTIRDAFADMLFPGTSAPQTRARYFLFVPWIYLRLERQRVPAVDIGRKARRAELDLIERLLAAGESDGVIGRLARNRLQRLPSSIYWNGLRRLGICLFEGSQEGYHQSVDAFYRRQRAVVETDDREAVEQVATNWHRGLPTAPEDFPADAFLALTRHEAEYLRDRIVFSAPGSLFAHLVTGARLDGDAEFPWFHSRYGELSAAIRRQLVHGRNFSEVMHGAALLYNLSLAELVRNDDWAEWYREELAEWAGVLAEREDEFARWDRADFWACVGEENPRIAVQTRVFVEEWWRLTLERSRFRRIGDVPEARTLIAHRERMLKRALARIDNPRARERWGGASGTHRLNYRWPNARRICRDISEAIEGRRNA